MKTITIAATALLLAGGIAFAGSDHYGADWKNEAVRTDNTHTSSTTKTRENTHQKAPGTVYRPTVPQDEYGQGIWGH